MNRLFHQANHDALTGLPNRLLFIDRVSQALRLAKRHRENVAIIFLDLDDFKLVNDTLGHAAGDLILCQVAERLKLSLRSEDTVARQGGDEFLILLASLTTIQQVITVVKKILKVLQVPFEIYKKEIYLTVSLGIAISPRDGDTPDILIQHADMAMYLSKEEGQNRYNFYTSELNESITNRLTLQMKCVKL